MLFIRIISKYEIFTQLSFDGANETPYSCIPILFGKTAINQLERQKL